MSIILRCLEAEFLMYRVELKEVIGRTVMVRPAGVPNVPCGVEMHEEIPVQFPKLYFSFLMHRAELKV